MSATFKDLTVWQKSYQLALDVYKVCEKMPSSEKYGLISQAQRCAVSIPSNLAEGQQRNNKLEFRQFIGVAKGSAAELFTQLNLIQDIYNIDCIGILDKTEEVQKMLSSLIKSISPSN